MMVNSDQHTEAPARGHIADLVKLAAGYADELQSDMGLNAICGAERNHLTIWKLIHQFAYRTTPALIKLNWFSKTS